MISGSFNSFSQVNEDPRYYFFVYADIPPYTNYTAGTGGYIKLDSTENRMPFQVLVSGKPRVP